MSHHSHSHNHHAHNSHASFNRAFAIAVSITLAYIIVEVICALFANSMSLLADAAHNFGDVLGLILAWIANWLLSFPAKRRYSYGFKRTTVLAALANAFILIATSVLIGYEAIYKFFHPSTVAENIVILIGLLGVFVNGGASLLFMRGSKHDLNIKSAFWHLFADMLLLVGVVISAIIIKFTGLMWIDPLVGIIIVSIVLWGTWGLLRDSVHLMLDAVPRYIDQNGVREYLKSIPGVSTIHDLHIWGLSTREVALTVHLIMPEKSLSDSDYKMINIILHERFRVDHATIQVERGDEAPCVRSENC